jgi:hypothetical protein
MALTLPACLRCEDSVHVTIARRADVTHPNHGLLVAKGSGCELGSGLAVLQPCSRPVREKRGQGRGPQL